MPGTADSPTELHAQPPVRYVILHLPGPTWRPGVSALEQTGVAEHLQYLGAAFARGVIELAGPFLREDAGSMVILSEHSTELEALQLAQEDPGVRSGLIRFEIRPWLTTLANPSGAMI